MKNPPIKKEKKKDMEYETSRILVLSSPWKKKARQRKLGWKTLTLFIYLFIYLFIQLSYYLLISVLIVVFDRKSIKCR